MFLSRVASWNQRNSILTFFIHYSWPMFLSVVGGKVNEVRRNEVK